MKLEQEVYGLHNGEGCEDFDAEETENKGSKKKKEYGDKENNEDEE